MTSCMHCAGSATRKPRPSSPARHRRAFLDQFDALSKDLTISDVRLKRIQPRDDGRSAEAVLEMDYQLLPSASLKTLRD